MRESTKNICLFFLTLILFFLFLEVVARISYPLYANYNTEMWRYASELKRPGTYSNLSHEHIPNREADLYGVHIKINSDGFRDKEYTVEKDTATFRILILGDSITFGWGVAFNNTFSKVLEQRLNQEKQSPDSTYEVLNLGVGNYNTVMETITLEKKGLLYNPDLIVLAYYINDVEITPKKPFFLFKYSYLYAFLWDKYQNIKVRFIGGNDYKSYYKKLYADNYSGMVEGHEALLSLVQLARERKIPLLIMIIPEFHQFKEYPFQEVTFFVTEIADEQGVPILDLLPFFLSYEPETVWVSYEDAHPNAVGHQVIADALYEEITSLFISNASR